MRAWLCTFLLLLARVPVRGAGDTPPNPDDHVRRAAGFLELNWPGEERAGQRRSIRFISFWDTPEKTLWDHRRYLSWWMHNLTFERDLNLPREVPGTDGRLLWIDLEWYGWNARAWEAVARRDPFTREPWVTFRAAEALRREAGYTGIEPDRDDTRPVLAMVNGAWFLRDTLETRRSASYYDLLYSRWRFPGEEEEQQWRTEDRNLPHGGGDFRYPDDSGRVHRRLDAGTYKFTLRFKVPRKAGGFVDFPRDLKDWESAFGIDVIRDFHRERKVSPDFGSIVEGGRDNPVNGSIVALSNRLIVNQAGAYGRLTMRTFDVLETAGKKDFSEALIFKDGKFKRGDGAAAEFDAGELLAYLPNGGQAGLLVNAEGKRVETAVADIANDSADKVLNQGVRTNGSCVVCHGGANGFIVPRDVETLDRQAGIVRKFKDRDKERRYREFFADYSEEIQGYTRPYARLVKATTVHPREEVFRVLGVPQRPWDGSDVARMTLELRGAYDAPVDAERAARTLGVSVEVFRFLCSRSPRQRPLQLLQGRPIPSATWERDVCREMGKLLDAYRDDPELKQLFGK